MLMGNYISVPLFLEHGSDTVPETIVTMNSWDLCLFNFLLDQFGQSEA